MKWMMLVIMCLGVSCLPVNAPVQQDVRPGEVRIDAAPALGGSAGVVVTAPKNEQNTAQSNQQGGFNVSWQTVGGAGLGLLLVWLGFTLLSNKMENSQTDRAAAHTIVVMRQVQTGMLLAFMLGADHASGESDNLHAGLGDEVIVCRDGLVMSTGFAGLQLDCLPPGEGLGIVFWGGGDTVGITWNDLYLSKLRGLQNAQRLRVKKQQEAQESDTQPYVIPL